MQNWSCTHLCGHSSIKFCGHVTLGLRIHFSYLSQPSVSKTCSFINSCIHLSPFCVFGKIFTTFTLQVYTHFSTKPFCVLIGESFLKKELEFISFQKRLGFLVKNIYFLFLFVFVVFFLFWPFFKRLKTARNLGTVDTRDYILLKNGM